MNIKQTAIYFLFLGFVSGASFGFLTGLIWNN